LGREGKDGGTGDDADMIGVISLTDENGKWADEYVDWIQEPEL
jgi:hypothetical protein